MVRQGLRASSEASGGDGAGLRLAGMQWHGEAHFLSDFPRAADPSALPPNLALLTGARDAQAYNPSCCAGRFRTSRRSTVGARTTTGC